MDPAEVTVEVHEVVSPTGARLGFGELAEAAMALPVPGFDEIAFKDEAQFRYMGKGEVPIVDLHDITTGAAVYGADVTRPGMKFAAVARPPVVGGSVKSYDATAAKAVPGVERIVELKGAPPPMVFAPLGGIAVVATNTWAALQGVSLLEIEWEAGPNGGYDSAAFRAEMDETAKAPGKVVRDQGDWAAARAASAKIVTRSYHQAHMAHAPMEPPTALAEVTATGVEVWAPVQSPFGTRQVIAATLGLNESAVTVHPTLLGGGFGRKSKCDFAVEAALISREVGAPVRVQWTREDDIRHGFYHSTSVDRIEAAVDANGKVTGWMHRVVAPSIVSTFAPDEGFLSAFENGMGHADLPFDIAAIRCENGPAKAHARIGWWRSVNNVPRAFAVQCFVAELAEELGRDHREVLLELIGPARQIDQAAMGVEGGLWNYGENPQAYPIDTGRLAHVLTLASDAAGWGQELPPGEDRPRRPPQLRELRRCRGAGEGRGRRDHRAPDRRGDRLRLPGQSRAHPQPDGRGLRHGHDPRPSFRDHLLGGRGGAEQLQRLRDGALRQLPHGHRAYRAASVQRPRRRRGGAWRAAHRARDRQRRLPRDRPAPARPAGRADGLLRPPSGRVSA